ncbi:MAG TPA: acyltransferase [Polyangiales bacterium]|nr:acyltransferase [Polyangiales bacterium]
MNSIRIQAEHDVAGDTQCAYGDWMLRYNQASLAWCFRERLDLERLAAALRRVLDDYPMYAGRFEVQPGALRIQHGHDVVLEHVASSESFTTLGAAVDAGRTEVLCPTLSVRRTLAGKHPLFMARLTDTRDGSAIGVTWHHAVGDLASTMPLLRAWGQAYGGAPYVAPPRVPDRAQYLDEHIPDPPDAVSSVRLYSFGEMCSLAGFLMQRKRRVDIAFSWDEIEHIQASLTRGTFVTASDALSAHVFWVLQQLQPERPPRRLVLAVNYRKRVGLPSNLVGNLLGTICIDVDADAEPASTAAAIRAQLKAYGRQHVEYHPTRRFLVDHPGAIERLRTMPNFFDASGRTWLLSNAANNGVYELEFGAARPELFCFATAAAAPMMSAMFESPKRAGLTMAMYLPAQLAARADSADGRTLMHAQPLAAAG